MHSEWYQISPDTSARINAAKDEGRRVIAVGTTALRALESSAVDGRVKTLTDDTQIFITPGSNFHIIDGLMTNFHLPKSTLFMLVSASVGTAGTVKGLYMDQVAQAGSDIILGNTYHLMLRPGAERVKKLGGLHKFGGWTGPILTDSGGFQVWSLSKLRKMTEEGVEFQSHHDGSKHMLSPERSIEIQADLLGADISMQLDECTEFPSPYEAAAKSMELSLRWGKRSLAYFGERENQTLFAIVQGSTFEDLRRMSAEASVREDMAGGYGGFAIGGLAVGEGHEAMCETLDFTVPHLPEDRPRYLMGVGKPIDLVEAVARGVDMFDCVIPTRSGRHGQVWTDAGPYNIKKAQYAEDASPIDADIDCPLTFNEDVHSSSLCGRTILLI